MIRQPIQSKWDMFIHGSVVNELLEKLTNVDVTIIEVNRKNMVEESEYQSGIHAFLSQNEKGYYLTYQNSSESVMEGIFFPNQKTDFETGIFKSIDKDNIHLINICEGKVDDVQSDAIKKIVK
ncbi:hypothetical protein [Salipaludibacillus sp. CF4.18]|uniref:hypothetical protein n=1 Tax=Salipaludibacillus sp. CF4.18 TaxID=3373081 RepID=UPI003EE65CC5